MKGMCPKCKKIVDETEFIQEKKMCIHCFEKAVKKVVDRVKALCDVLETDHIGYINEAVEKLMKEYNDKVFFKV